MTHEGQNRHCRVSPPFDFAGAVDKDHFPPVQIIAHTRHLVDAVEKYSKVLRGQITRDDEFPGFGQHRRIAIIVERVFAK